jgi:hypothetical protein
VVWLTSRNADNESSATNRPAGSAYGMIGAKLVGRHLHVGARRGNHSSAIWVVFGYLLGYAPVIALVDAGLLRMNLTSICTYLEAFWQQLV